ncbi:MAG: Na/Pi cotransporter family protein [Oscillospiraceae bacterium]|nr:Na/Pi cotransporter family protein [Oscillospiraceae bacterium]
MGYLEWFQVVGGLGLLLFGMKMMSTGLQAVAGDSLHTILKRATSNRFLAIIAGIVATICINSSTAVTIITVGFVNSKLLSLTQAIGIIMGANVGTTFSAQLIAFKIDAVAPLIIFIGVVMHLFFKKRNIKNIGYIILGFGILLFSITTMGAPLKEFANQPSFNAMLTSFKNPIAALFAGFIFTAVIQSSSATMGLLVTMHLSGVPIPFETSAFIILGTNIGTSTTTVIASIPASRESKRAALFHITYDIIGSIVFGTLIFVFPSILGWFESTWSETARQVAMFHTLYNVATLCLLLPFIKQLSWLLQKVIPLKPEEINKKTHEKKLMYLDFKLGQKTPALAVVNAHLEVCRMGEIVNENLNLALKAFFESDTEKAKKVMKNEETVDYLNQHIAAKLVELNSIELSVNSAERIGSMFGLLIDIERIGDHAENIAEYVIIMKDEGITLSDVAMEELKVLNDLVIKIADKSISTYKDEDCESLSAIQVLEDKIDDLSETFVNNHIKRLKGELCNPKGGMIFTDLIGDLERIADHAYNVAFSIITKEEKKSREKVKINV